MQKTFQASAQKFQFYSFEPRQPTSINALSALTFKFRRTKCRTRRLKYFFILYVYWLSFNSLTFTDFPLSRCCWRYQTSLLIFLSLLSSSKRYNRQKVEDCWYINVKHTRMFFPKKMLLIPDLRHSEVPWSLQAFSYWQAHHLNGFYIGLCTRLIR